MEHTLRQFLLEDLVHMKTDRNRWVTNGKTRAEREVQTFFPPSHSWPITEWSAWALILFWKVTEMVGKSRRGFLKQFKYRTRWSAFNNYSSHDASFALLVVECQIITDHLCSQIWRYSNRQSLILQSWNHENPFFSETTMVQTNQSPVINYWHLPHELQAWCKKSTGP